MTDNDAKLCEILRAANYSMTDRAADLIESQASRITALESERDALLAVAGKGAARDGLPKPCDGRRKLQHDEQRAAQEPLPVLPNIKPIGV